MNDIPEWLRPYLKQDSYNPPKQDITNLEPQSRSEMLLKYIILNSAGGKYDDIYFTTTDDEYFTDSDDNEFIVTGN